MKLKLIILFFLTLICSCASTKKEVANIYPNNKEKRFTILSYDEKPSVFAEFDSSRYADFTVDTVRVDSIVAELVKTHNQSRFVKKTGFLTLLPNDNYYKQVIAFKDSKGRKVLWVNCLCEKFEEWEREYVHVQGGGNCYFNFFLYKNEDKIYSMSINSEM